MNKELFQYYIGKYCFILIIPFTFIIFVLSAPLLITTHYAYFNPINLKCVSTKDKNSVADDVDLADIFLASIMGFLLILLLFVTLIMFIIFPKLMIFLVSIGAVIVIVKKIIDCRQFYNTNKDNIERLNEIHKL